MNEKSRNEFIRRVKKIAIREESKLEELKYNYNDLKRDDFLWHYLLQSFSTMGNSRGWHGLIGNQDNYNKLKFEILDKIKDSKKRMSHIKTICRQAKIRMPDKKAEFIENCYLRIIDLGGLVPAKEALLKKVGRNNKIQFLKEFSGIGDKYARNIMMDVYHEDFRDSIAVDSRLKNILSSWNYKIIDYEKTEQFLLKIAKDSNLNGWELDRLLYNFESDFIEVRSQKTTVQEKFTNTNNAMDELSYTERNRKQAIENKVVEKLNELRNKFLKEPEFLSYCLSFVDDSDSDNYCIWLSGFSDIVRIQIKHQLRSEKIVINLRPLSNKLAAKEKFKNLMVSKGIKVKVGTGKPYVPIQEIFSISNYNIGISREYYQDIKKLLISSIAWIKD